MSSFGGIGQVLTPPPPLPPTSGASSSGSAATAPSTGTEATMGTPPASGSAGGSNNGSGRSGGYGGGAMLPPPPAGRKEAPRARPALAGRGAARGSSASPVAQGQVVEMVAEEPSAIEAPEIAPDLPEPTRADLIAQTAYGLVAGAGRGRSAMQSLLKYA